MKNDNVTRSVTPKSYTGRGLPDLLYFIEK